MDKRARPLVDLHRALLEGKLADFGLPVLAERLDRHRIVAAGHFRDIERHFLEAAVRVPNAETGRLLVHVVVVVSEDKALCRNLVAAKRVLGRSEGRLAFGLRMGRGLAEREVRLVTGLRLILSRIGLLRIEATVRNIHHLELEIIKPDRRLGLPEVEFGHIKPDRAEDTWRGHVGRRDFVALPVGREINNLDVVRQLQLELDARL